MNIFVLTRARIAQVVGLVAAVVATLGGFGIVHWSVAQATMVGTEASTFLVVILAVEQHVRPGTPREPVAVAGSITAFAASTFALLVGFEIVHWSAQQIGLALGLVVAVIALVNNWAARAAVTPMTEHLPTVASAHAQGMAATARKGGSDGSGLPGAPQAGA